MAERKKKNQSIGKGDSPGSLFDRAHLASKGATLESLHSLTGLPISWLRKFRAGEIKNPSVNRIEKILNAFNLL